MNANKIIVLSKKDSKKLHKMLDEYNSEEQIDKHVKHSIIHNTISPSAEMIKEIMKKY